jgi:superfamily II DNA or RNA helicase
VCLNGGDKMIELILGNVDTKIVGKYPVDIVHEITSYKIPGAEHSPRFRAGEWDGRKKFLNRFNNTFPTGLSGDVLRALRQAGEKVKVTDERVKPKFGKPIKVSAGYEDRPYQVEAIEKSIQVSRGILNIATNGGKTYIASRIISKTNLNTLFLVHRKELMYQTKAEFEQVLGIKVGVIGDGKYDPQKITVAMIPTLTQNLRKHKKFFQSIEMLFADECHHLGSSTWFNIFEHAKNAYYRFGLSGTPTGRSDGGGMFLQCATGKMICSVTNKELIDEGVSAKPHIYMQECTVEEDEGKWQHIYKSQIVENTHRNSLICDWIEKYIKEGLQTLVLIEQTEHGRNLQKMMKKRGYDVPFTHGSSNKKFREQCLVDFKEGKIQTMIASTIYDEGISVDGIQVAIFGGSKKSPIGYMQRVGRGLRRKKNGENKVIIVDFFDKGQKHLEKWSEMRLGLYEAASNDFDVEFVKE